MNFLVLEGLDGSGKTTFAREITTGEYHHVGPPGDGGSFPELAADWWCAAPNTFHVWDRGHLGEDVYGPLYRGTRLTRAARNVLRFVLEDRNAAVIWLDVLPELIEPELLGDRLAERHRFQEAIRLFHYPVYHLQSRASLREWWTMHYHEISDRATADPLGVGSRTPGLWLLGEQASTASRCTLPFFTTSGMETVWLEAQDHTTIRVSNALPPAAPLEECRKRVQDPWVTRLRERWEGLACPRTVCLGQTADKYARAAGIQVDVALEHPQYVWRFRHRELPNYRRMLQACLRQG